SFADGALIKPRKPPAEPDGPEGKVTERHGPTSGLLDFPHRKKNQPKHRLRDLVLRKNQFADFADQRQSGAQTVIALGLVKRFEKVALLNAHQIASFPFHIPNLHVREELER